MAGLLDELARVSVMIPAVPRVAAFLGSVADSRTSDRVVGVVKGPRDAGKTRAVSLALAARSDLKAATTVVTSGDGHGSMSSGLALAIECPDAGGREPRGAANFIERQLGVRGYSLVVVERADTLARGGQTDPRALEFLARLWLRSKLAFLLVGRPGAEIAGAALANAVGAEVSTHGVATFPASSDDDVQAFAKTLKILAGRMKPILDERFAAAGAAPPSLDELHSDPTARRLLLASKGRIGVITRLARGAIREAVTEMSPKLALKHFGEPWRQLYAGDEEMRRGISTNPFTGDAPGIAEIRKAVAAKVERPGTRDDLPTAYKGKGASLLRS